MNEGLSTYEIAQMIGGLGLSTALSFAVITLWRSLETARKALGDKIDSLQKEWREDVIARSAQVERAMQQELECQRKLAELGVQVERTRARLDAIEDRR
jgi:hypothetical protein